MNWQISKSLTSVALLLALGLVFPSVSPAQVTYSNTSSITINDNTSATPYPSTITVPSLSGTVTMVTVTITGFAQTWPDDVDILLVGPQGQKVMLMSDQGGGNPVTGVNLTFDDSADAALSNNSLITSGTYKPGDFETSETMPAPAPAGPYGTLLSAFNGVDPQGTWSLYVRDDATNDVGSISGGWALTLTGVSQNPADLQQIHYRWRN